MSLKKTILPFALSVLFLPIAVRADVAQTVADRRAVLEQELANLQVQIDAQQKILEDRQKQSVSLERDIAILNAKIEEAKLSIRARNIEISRLSADISGKEKTLGFLSAKIEREQESLAQIIRKTNELDSYGMPVVLLGNKNLSDFFSDFGSFASIKQALQDSLDTIKDSQTKTTVEKSSLEDKRQEQVDLRAIQILEEKRVEQDEAEKSKILKSSRGLEAEYQKIIKAKQQDAAKISAELFTLSGSVAIPFEKALKHAVEAGKATGVRPALILGIIAEESNLGENVGKGNWRVDMANPRDTIPFLGVTSRLGLNPDSMPVSKKAWYGYGGAMGPAQFIPSTWVLYEDRIAAATGHRPPNPWDPGDAFTAAALLLSDSGAAKKTVAAERFASLCYLAGCKNANKKAYAFYANDVMDLADKYQKQINILNSQ